MHPQEWTKIWRNTRLDVGLLQAYYVDHAFPRHSHDYYVVCLIRRGLQSFTHKGAKHYTPPGGLILINPDIVHTGEAADEKGFIPLLILIIILLTITTFCATSVWTLFGTIIKLYLHYPPVNAIINIILSLFLVYTAIELAGII